ncbi:MAG TPA: hypothetical protein ENN67_02225, partial [Firmicutes bacterium]|nr:hypothetical protein [Bacillota bacterium]
MRFFSTVMLLSLVIGAISCSGAGSPAVSPEISQELSPAREIHTGERQLWGLYDISIDPDTMEATVVPNRNGMFRINVTNFMNSNPALLGLQITDGTKFKTLGELTLNISLTHPLPTKPKLAGMDVHAIFMSNGSGTLKHDTAMKYPVEGTDAVLLNPDGWTRWYNAVEFTTPGMFGYSPGIMGNIPSPTATINGYKLYADGLGSTGNAGTWLTSNQGTRAIFTAGTTNQRRFILKFPMSAGKPVAKFQYAVVASWDKPSVDDPLPQDFPLTANIQEASHLRISASNSTLYYTPQLSGGDLVMSIDVFDWQG